MGCRRNQSQQNQPFRNYRIHNNRKEKADDPENQLFVFFPEDEKVGVKPIKILTDRMKDEQVSQFGFGPIMKVVTEVVKTGPLKLNTLPIFCLLACGKQVQKSTNKLIA